MSFEEGEVPPFLQNIIARNGLKPSGEEINHMKRTSVRELTLFFDMLNEGKSDMDVYSTVLRYCKLRYEKGMTAKEAMKESRPDVIEAKARAEREAKEKAEAERRAKQEAEAKAKAAAEAKAKAEEEARARAAAARADAQRKREEAERRAREESERKAKEEAERKAREEAERKASEERKAREEAERKASEERKAREEAERRAREEADRKARAEEQARHRETEEARKRDGEALRAAEARATEAEASHRRLENEAAKEKDRVLRELEKAKKKAAAEAEARRKLEEEMDALRKKQLAAEAAAAAAPKSSEPQPVRAISETLDVLVDDKGDDGLVLTVRNKDSRPVLTRFDFAASVNYKFSPKGTTKKVPAGTAGVQGDATFELQIPADCTVDLGEMGIVDHCADKCTLVYKVLVSSKSVNDDDRKKLADGVFLLIKSDAEGYKMNMEVDLPKGTTMEVGLDLSNSINLSVVGASPYVDVEDAKKATLVVAGSGTKKVLDFINLPVTDYEKGTCELRYRPSLKKLST